jgi:type 1 fimbria pilin
LAYEVSIPSTVTLNGPGAPMTATLSLDTATGTLSGSNSHYVGATLAVGAGQTAGTYSGSFTVTVNYQ